MTKLDRKPREVPFEDDDPSADDIEIIEIVGMDDDPPINASSVETEIESENEIILDLDADEGAIDTSQLGPRSDGLSAGADSEIPSEQLLRLRADFQNFKSRVERDQEATRRNASAALVSRLLPVLDNFERAVSSAPSAAAHATFHEGVSLIFRQILEELRKEGLAAIDSVGEIFNPELHEAVATDTESDFPPHTVVEELQRGYLLHDRLLRPSLVRVRVEPTGAKDPSAGPEDS